MKKLNGSLAASNSFLSDILPPGFDFGAVQSFFDTPNGNSNSEIEFPSAALDALRGADELAATDLREKSKPLDEDWFVYRDEDDDEDESSNGDDDPDTVGEDYGDPDYSNTADAKPSHAGGGKKSDTSDGGGGGKGKGKNKPHEDEAPTEPDPTPEEPPQEEPPQEEPPQEDPPQEEPPAEDPGTGETNPGTTDPNTYISGMDTPDGFNIELVFSGEWLDVAKQAVIDSAELLSDYIIGDVTSYNGIDDIRIDVASTNIDGDGGVIGRGGWDSMNPHSGTISVGHLTLDSSDIDLMVNRDILEETVLHEMLHVMGFGTAWWDQGLKEYHGADGNDIRFVGEKATAVYNSTYADIASTDPNSHIGVPIEDGGGSGARGKHWDEGTFDHELMSTHVDNGEHITDLTLAALEDMGYETTFDEADELLGFV